MSSRVRGSVSRGNPVKHLDPHNEASQNIVRVVDDEYGPALPRARVSSVLQPLTHHTVITSTFTPSPDVHCSSTASNMLFSGRAGLGVLRGWCGRKDLGELL
jgi:hypothetical protein